MYTKPLPSLAVHMRRLAEAHPHLQCSLREAPGLAAAIRDVLARRLPVGETAEAVWDALWPAEKRRQVPACCCYSASIQSCVEQKCFETTHIPGLQRMCAACLSTYSKSARHVSGVGNELCTASPAPCVTAAHARQAAFHVFGMELLASLDLAATNDFFRAFFRLPDPLWAQTLYPV